VGAASVVLLSSLNAAGLALRPFTVIRTRGWLMATSDQHTGDEFPFGALGFAIVNERAANLGITAVPLPNTDAGSSLFFSWTPWFAPIAVGSDISFGDVSSHVEFDSRAMRKVEVGDDLVVTVENQSTTDGALFLFQARILIKTN